MNRTKPWVICVSWGIRMPEECKKEWFDDDEFWETMYPFMFDE
jgi:hypothetical protein